MPRFCYIYTLVNSCLKNQQLKTNKAAIKQE